MASILEFSRSTVRASAPKAHDGARPSAEIVFFPGVRYERASGGPEPAPQEDGRRGHRKRDRIDLEA